MGHEFTGEVLETGPAVHNFKKGDRVVSPFTLSCGECFYCAQGCSSRCAKGKLFGSAVLDGGQAEYVRVPLADGTLVAAPAAIDEKKLVLMADIFPTGYFAARNAFRGWDEEVVRGSTVVLFGCGPVGLCALISALEYRPAALIAVDSVPDRLERARSLGAEAFELLRPWGRISSVGVHNGEIPWTGNEAYGKNLQIQMGRCPVRSIFGDALELLVKKQDSLE
jgi:threonine dehydrogenase-like Zn-dependent dehydrogenase